MIFSTHVLYMKEKLTWIPDFAKSMYVTNFRRTHSNLKKNDDVIHHNGIHIYIRIFMLLPTRA